jgi:hypothetical protein
MGREGRRRRFAPVKNKVEKVGMFFDAKKRGAIHHVLPRIHHTITSKKPRSAPAFLENPLQKHPSTTD